MKTSKITNNKPFSEVIESSLAQYKAQCWQWDHYPAYGSLVCVQQEKHLLIGVVHETQTGSSDPSRSPYPYQKTEEQLKKEQPQIFEFLKTAFSCIILGFRYKERWHYTSPPYPAKVHSFVRSATKEEIHYFLSQERYLHRLFNLAYLVNNVDELLLALLANQAETGNATQPGLKSFLQTYALLTGNDYRRIKLFLQQAQPFIQMQK